jgi:hypothetical protein
MMAAMPSSRNTHQLSDFSIVETAMVSILPVPGLHRGERK